MKFGEVVKYREYEYVYLMETTETAYLAKIHNKEYSEKLILLQKKVFTEGSRRMAYIQASPRWAFMELSTKEFKDRVAYYGLPAFNLEDVMDVIADLDKEDKKRLKRAIEIDPGVAKELREHVSNIELEESQS